VVIRIAHGNDATAIADIYAPYVTATAISFETHPPGSTEMAGRIAATLPRHPWIVATQHDAVIGYAYGGAHRPRPAYRWSVDVSAYVHSDHQGGGVGRALYTMLLALLEAQGYRSAFAAIALPNPASVSFHESLGFEPVGVYREAGWKLDRWYDVEWWQKRIRLESGAPTEPIPLDALEPDVVESILSSQDPLDGPARQHPTPP
jgi:L-amino acid N-acyltransferase YncA